MKLLLPTVVLVAGVALGLGLTVNAQDGSTPHVEIPEPDPDKQKQDPHGGDGPPKAQVGKANAALERIAKLEAEVEALRAERAQTDKALQAIVGYLEARAKAAGEMAKSLDTVEAAGFTAGINPRSREVLLGSWRGFLAAEGQSLPKISAKPAAGDGPKADARGARGRRGGRGSY